MNEHLKEFLTVMSKLPSREEFTKAFEAAIALIVKSETKLVDKIDRKQSENTKEIESLKGDVQKALVQMKEATDSTFVQLKKRSMDSIENLFLKMRLGDRFDSLVGEFENKIQGMERTISAVPTKEEFLALIPKVEEPKEETGEQIVDKINALSTENDVDKIDAVHIKNLPEATNRIVQAGWGAHSLTIKGLGVVIDKNTRVINFTGSGLTSVTRSRDGVVTVTLTAGAGSGTLVTEEVPVDSGDHLNFTIAHTPDTGTLRVFRGGARQASIGVTPDFSLSGTTLTLTNALSTGETLLVEYTWN
jgi:hypothetical protein